MSLKDDTIANLLACYDATEALCGELNDADWATQSLCPDWTSQGVIAHLAGIEDVMSGWLPTGPDDPPPFEKMGAYQAAADRMSPAELTESFVSIAGSRRAELAALTDAQFDAPSITPVGLQTYGRFLAIRVFDFFMHNLDIRVPTGRRTAEAESGPIAEMALQETIGSMGYIAGKKISLEDGMSLRFNLTGPVERQICVAVDGRAGLVDSLDAPDVEVTTDSTTFQLLACGRIDPQQPIDDGQISWSGSDGWGEKAARNLRYTM
ncbi:MAG: maleylpyruvate isomerase family protein [Acidimicrobiales bacterium]|nr:maleylpyruvate isomerase family protein [Acidimicrobiales bacterium]